MVLTPEEKSAFKFAQLQAVDNKSPIQVFENILGQEGDINFAIPVDSHYKVTRPYMKGYTTLHYSCMINNIELFNCLLTHGADFIKTNNNCQTVIHMVIENHKSIKEPLDNPFIDAVLSAHVNTNNFCNPTNKDGLSHFHAACMTKHSVAVKFFLDNGVSIDEPVGKDSKFAPGFAPLHLAAMCSNTIIAELLLANGANMHIKDARGMTPLHVLIEQRLQMYDSIGNALHEKGNLHEKLQQQILENEKIISMLLENLSSDNDSLDTIGLSNFQIACTLKDTSVAQNLVDRVVNLDHCVNMNSHLWPGYTALHFAAHIDIKTVEMLLDNGASIEAKDSRGLTPLDICMERYKIEDICNIEYLSVKYENLMFSDGRTKVLTFIREMTDSNQFRKFLGRMQDINTRIPMESPLWPGFTPLHFVVLCAESSKHQFTEDRRAKKTIDIQFIRRCFFLGADLSFQDIRGRSALHLAFLLDKSHVIDTILRYCRRIPVVADEDNLTHVHIVCATKTRMNRLKQCVLNESAVNAAYKGTKSIGNVKPGATPLHVCLVCPEYVVDLKTMIRMLLKSGADVNAKDANGLTPIHRLLESSSKFDYRAVATQMLTKVTNDCVVEEYKLSYLHVACNMRNQAAMKRLIKKGANINLTIEYTGKSDDESVGFLSRYHKCTPLHMSNLPVCDEDKLLFDHGADAFAVNADGKTALDWSPTLHYFLSTVQDSDALQERVRREFGWTKLHVRCYLLVVDGFERSIEDELTDINARVYENSPIWKGCTPLHLLMYRGQKYSAEEKAYGMSRILLDNVADVTVMDFEKNTPISMMFEYSVNDKTRKQAALLMKHHRDFNVNPVNGLGISHFHLACYLNDVDAVEGFLLRDVDVNRPIDYFSSWYPGYTPLHLASQSRVVELLISHGADIHTEDVSGCSVLAEAMRRDLFDEDAVTKIIEHGANVNGMNANGQTPFEIAISRGRMTMEKLKFCVERGFHVNSCNPISGVGYIAIVLKDHKYPNNDSRMNVVETIMNESSTAILGRNTIHHIVTGTSGLSVDQYVNLFEKLVKFGCDLDVQDDKGRTALHLAVRFSNERAVIGLLTCGVDINILDVNGKSALSYDSIRSDIKHILTAHVCKLAFLKLDICKSNVADITGMSIYNYTFSHLFLEQIAVSKKVAVQGVRSLRLYDFLTETGAVMICPKLNESEQRKIEPFFEVVNSDGKLRDIKSIMKLQYRKTVKRAELLPSATNSFRLLLGFDLPDLCVDNVFQYLRNYELENIISAEIGMEDMRMDVE